MRHWMERVYVSLSAAVCFLAFLTANDPATGPAERQLATDAEVADAAPQLSPKSMSSVGLAPRGQVDYAQRWRQIAEEFYAQHPPAGETTKSTEASKLTSTAQPVENVSPVVTASLRTGSDSRSPEVKGVSHVQTSEPSGDRQAKANDQALITQRHAATPMTQRPAAWIAALSTGILICVLYQLLMPAARADLAVPLTLDVANQLRLELPREWVRQRRTLSQAVRPMFLLLIGVAATASSIWLC